MDIARQIVASGSLDEGWNVIRDHHDEFLWTDDEEPAIRWNELARRTGATALLEIDWNGERPKLCLLGQTRRVPLVYERDDAFIWIHAIAQIGAEILEVRFCSASAHSSDKAFFARRPSEWVEMERSLGVGQVAAQFLRIPTDVRDLARLLYAPFGPPRWATV